MEQERQNFIHGKVNDDGSVEVRRRCGKRAWTKRPPTPSLMRCSSFASYAFNKSHAAAYAVVAYQTAFLKCHYTKEYMCCVAYQRYGHTRISSSAYIEECAKLGIRDEASQHQRKRYGLYGQRQRTSGSACWRSKISAGDSSPACWKNGRKTAPL